MDAAAVWTENSHFRGRPLEHDETRASCVFGKSIKYPKAATDSPCDLGSPPRLTVSRTDLVGIRPEDDADNAHQAAVQAFTPTSRCLEGSTNHPEKLTPSPDLPRLGLEMLPASSELFLLSLGHRDPAGVFGRQSSKESDRAQVVVRFRGSTE
ncbi:hypothetical protein MJG53_015166 [Ovis ammon polii x Ovis aries]|uniref:Uncharacterized protein n=1 Tax=Ovis ammon polii x Ovis aries TaxID=2918886 RepID=A0ACB9UEP6_9CETA|nr:hypothetical protein MJG53_015166 [Ovis ammon polii x Ovis aries]